MSAAARPEPAHLPLAGIRVANFGWSWVGPVAGQTLATVERLGGEDVVEEIRRMLGGDERDEGAIERARELLEAA